MLTKTLIAVLTVTACLAVPSNIIRPCKLHNKECIRENLAINSQCNPNVRGFVPSEYTIPSFRYDTPYFNATYIDQDLIIKNHNNCRVSEFFFNMASDAAVLALDCPALDFSSTRMLIQHYSLREDTQFSFSFSGNYPLVRLTMHLPHANAMDLCTSFTFADVTELPIFNINPNGKTSKFT
ncbi:unnamed protein product, partial [Brenthis ino]